MIRVSYGSSGKFAASQALKPPSSAAVSVIPFVFKKSAARALVSSAGQVQYVMIFLFFGKVEMRAASMDSGKERAPLMCAV